MGDMVNLASRLEGANKFFGTTIMASETTVAPPARHSPGASSTASGSRAASSRSRSTSRSASPTLCPPGQALRVEAYQEGLARYRARDFAGALEAFNRHPDDPPAAKFAARVRELLAEPPGPDWEPINALEEKVTLQGVTLAYSRPLSQESRGWPGQARP